MANEMRDRHLVTDNPQGMIESMLNFAYAKNEKVYLRYANGTEDIDLCEYVARFTETNGCMLSADDVMEGSCIEGCDCEMAILYTLGVQAAELRERLKYYENLEDQGLLQTLPCKVGDICYPLPRYRTPIVERKISRITYSARNIIIGYYENDGQYRPPLRTRILGEDVFLTKSEAEQKLKEMRGE